MSKFRFPLVRQVGLALAVAVLSCIVAVAFATLSSSAEPIHPPGIRAVNFNQDNSLWGICGNPDGTYTLWTWDMRQEVFDTVFTCNAFPVITPGSSSDCLVWGQFPDPKTRTSVEYFFYTPE